MCTFHNCFVVCVRECLFPPFVFFFFFFVVFKSLSSTFSFSISALLICPFPLFISFSLWFSKQTSGHCLFFTVCGIVVPLKCLVNVTHFHRKWQRVIEGDTELSIDLCYIL